MQVMARITGLVGMFLGNSRRSEWFKCSCGLVDECLAITCRLRFANPKSSTQRTRATSSHRTPFSFGIRLHSVASSAFSPLSKPVLRDESSFFPSGRLPRTLSDLRVLKHCQIVDPSLQMLNANRKSLCPCILTIALLAISSSRSNPD